MYEIEKTSNDKTDKTVRLCYKLFSQIEFELLILSSLSFHIDTI